MLRHNRLIVLPGLFFPSMGFFLDQGSLVVLWIGSRGSSTATSRSASSSPSTRI
jgi:hypothetical protein